MTRTLLIVHNRTFTLQLEHWATAAPSLCSLTGWSTEGVWVILQCDCGMRRMSFYGVLFTLATTVKLLTAAN